MNASLISLFEGCSGMQTFTGEYLCWMADGFLMGIDGYEIPPTVITRTPTFSDYPGDSDTNEGKTIHVLGRMDKDRMAIRAMKWRADDQEEA